MHNPILNMDAMEDAFPTQEEYIKETEEMVEGTVFESMPDLYDELDLTWLDVLHENRDHLTVDAAIGSEGFEKGDLMQNGQVLRVLSENPNSSIHDINRLLAKQFLYISEVIEDNFENNSEYIDYVDETNVFNDDRESLEKELEEEDEDQHENSPFANFFKRIKSSILQ